MKLYSKLIILFFPFFISCVLFQSGSDRVTDMLPRESDVPGWNISGSIVYASGDSEISSYKKEYTGLGIDSLAVSEYINYSDNERVIKVEVIRFNNILYSYSFFSSVRGFDMTARCSREEYYNDNIALVRAGEFLILVKTEKNVPENRKDLKEFSDVSRSYIGTSYTNDTLPPFSNILENAGASCVLYSRTNLPFLPGISRVYYSMVVEEEKRYYVFLSDRESFERSMNVFQKIISKKYIIIKADNIQSAFIRENNGMYTFISVYDRWIYGCWGISDINDGKRVLANIKNVIESYSSISQ